MKSKFWVLVGVLLAALGIWWWSANKSDRKDAVPIPPPASVTPSSAPKPTVGAVSPNSTPSIKPSATSASAPPAPATPPKAPAVLTDVPAVVQDLITRIKAGDAVAAFEDYGPWLSTSIPPSNADRVWWQQLCIAQSLNMLQVLEAMSTQTPAYHSDTKTVIGPDGPEIADSDYARYNIIDPVTGQKASFTFYKSNFTDGRWVLDLNALTLWDDETKNPKAK